MDKIKEKFMADIQSIEPTSELMFTQSAIAEQSQSFLNQYVQV